MLSSYRLIKLTRSRSNNNFQRVGSAPQVTNLIRFYQTLSGIITTPESIWGRWRTLRLLRTKRKKMIMHPRIVSTIWQWMRYKIT